MRAVNSLCIMLLIYSCQINHHNAPDATSPSTDSLLINQKIDSAIQLAAQFPDSCIRLSQDIFSQSTEVHYQKGIGDSYQLLGRAYFHKYEFDSAYLNYSKALEHFTKLHHKKGMANALHGLSYVYSVNANRMKSLKCGQLSYDLYAEIDDLKGMLNAIGVLQYLYHQSGNTAEEEASYRKMIELSDRLNESDLMAQNHIGLGNYYTDQLRINQAIEEYFKALGQAETIGDSVLIADALGNIGSSYVYLKEYRNGLSYYKRQKRILEALHDEYELSVTYRGMAGAYNSLNEYRLALEVLNKAFVLSENLNHKLTRAKVLQDLGLTYHLMQKNQDSSRFFLKKAIVLNKEIDYSIGLCENYVLMGKTYLFEKKYPLAERYLKKADELAEQTGDKSLIFETSGQLSSLYSKTGNYQLAYKNQEIYNTLKDSISSEKNLKKITQLEMQHEFDKQKSETELLHLAEKMEIESALKRNKTTRNFFIVIAILLIGFGIFAYNHYLKSQKANREKEALLKEIHHRVKNNLQVISSLLNLQSGAIHDESSKAAVQESQSRVKSMALIHQLLYQSELFTRIDFKKYLEQLLETLYQSYSKPGENIRYQIQSDSVELDIDTAIPLGLIINELATNAFKYAFRNNPDGKLEIKLQRPNSKIIHLSVTDNGMGFPKNFDPDKTNSLGLRLVKILSKQLKAQLEINSSNGVCFNLKIPYAA